MNTPGPWHIEHPFQEPGTYISGPHTQLIAKIYNEEDAALIAAAPALLAALEKVTDHLEHVILAFDDGWVGDDDWNRVWDAREAIALVRGN